MRQKALSIINEVKKAVIGKDDVICKILIMILAKGHILLEDTPGVGKTTMALAFSKAMELDYKRVQFTPEVMPADVVGFSVYNQDTGQLDYKPGAILCNLFLADEINRTSSKTQSALLQAMEERQVTVEGVTRKIAEPFTVIATQNPVGSAGTQLLPESQLDRFMARITMGYPAAEDEVQILKRQHNGDPMTLVRKVADAREIAHMQQEAEEIYMDDDIYSYITRLVAATRGDEHIRLGASPRGSIALARTSRAYAWLAGRDYVIPSDIHHVFFDVLEHRILLSSKARAASVSTHGILEEILHTIPAPAIAR